jgi:hypothetical protein
VGLQQQIALKSAVTAYLSMWLTGHMITMRPFLCAFAELLEATISFVMCLSVCMEQLGSHWTDFHGIRYLSIFRKSVEKIQVSFKSDKNNGYCTWRPIYICYHISLISFRMRYVADKCCRGNENKHFMFNNFFFSRKSCRLWDNVEKVCRTGKATDDNLAHAHCMMDTQGYRETLGIRNIYCFSTTIMVARRRLNDMLYVHRLSCMTFEQTCRQCYPASTLRDFKLYGEKWNYTLHST